VYYRVYTDDDGALPTQTPADRTDPYLGRIRATSITPPHTVSSLKRRLLDAEHLLAGDHHTGQQEQDCVLFLTVGSPSPMDDAEKISICSTNSPGSLRQQPLALVVRVKLSDAERSALPEVEADKTSFKLGSNIVSGEPCYGTNTPPSPHQSQVLPRVSMMNKH